MIYPAVRPPDATNHVLAVARALTVGLRAWRFKPQVKLVRDSQGHAYESDMFANRWERDARGDYLLAIVEAVDPQDSGVDPLVYIENVGDRTH
jgi:hypothetical protein